MAGWVAERIAQPGITGHLRTTVAQLARRVEHARMRDQAAERRAARTGGSSRSADT